MKVETNHFKEKQRMLYKHFTENILRLQGIFD